MSSPPTEKPVADTVTNVGLYAQLLPLIRAAARRLGYAIGLHGSVVRDLDLIAVPWTDDAASAEELAAAVCAAVSAFIPNTSKLGDRFDEWGHQQNSTPKPHGRVAWSICFGGRPYIDLSVMPRTGGAR